MCDPYLYGQMNRDGQPPQGMDGAAPMLMEPPIPPQKIATGNDAREGVRVFSGFAGRPRSGGR